MSISAQSIRSFVNFKPIRPVQGILALTAIAFPLASVWRDSPLSRYTSGIFDVEGPVLLLVSILSSLLALSVMTTWWVITAYGGARCRARCTYAVYPIRGRWYGVAALLVLPVCAATLQGLGDCEDALVRELRRSAVPGGGDRSGRLKPNGRRGNS